jgi:excisionase family DNA binding protein
MSDAIRPLTYDLVIVETQESPELISVAEAARIANVSRVHMWRLVDRGEVEAYRIGKDHGPLRIPRREFLTWLTGEPEEAA